MVSPQLEAVYQRAWVLQQRATELPLSQQAILVRALEELHAVLEELQASEESLRHQNEALVNTRQAVEAERQRYRELFEFAPDGYLVTDSNGSIQEANTAIATLFNVSQPFLIGKPLLVFIDQPDRSRFHLTLDQLQQLDKIQDWELRLRSPHRSSFDAALTVATVRNAAGQIVSLRWLLHDITKRKRVERLLENLNVELERQVQERTTQLQQALNFEASLKRITDKVRDSLDENQILQTVVQELALVLGLICCDTSLYDLDLATSTIRYKFTNAARAVLPPSAQGRTVAMSTFPEGYRQLLQGESFQFCELAANSTRCSTVLACPIVDEQCVLGDLWLFKQKEDAFSEPEMRLVQQVANQCAIAIRQARLYQASQVQIQAMQKLDQLKDHFLSTTSHELRSPITNMRMSIRMLTIALAQERSAAGANLEKAGSTDRYLQILDAECDREISLINDLLDLQRLEAGEYPLVMEPIRLQDWLPEMATPFHDRARDRQQTLQINVSPDLPILLSDPAVLERLLAELLNNACKYTSSEGQITVDVQTVIHAQLGSTQIRISNTSKAIAANELTHIFDKFYRIPHSDPWKQGGTGLGLALVQKQTEHLGGTIAVENTPGQIHFTVELPFIKQMPSL